MSLVKWLSLFFVGIEEMYIIGIFREFNGKLEIKIFVFLKEIVERLVSLIGKK